MPQWEKMVAPPYKIVERIKRVNTGEFLGVEPATEGVCNEGGLICYQGQSEGVTVAM